MNIAMNIAAPPPTIQGGYGGRLYDLETAWLRVVDPMPALRVGLAFCSEEETGASVRRPYHRAIHLVQRFPES